MCQCGTPSFLLDSLLSDLLISFKCVSVVPNIITYLRFCYGNNDDSGAESMFLLPVPGF